MSQLDDTIKKKHAAFLGSIFNRKLPFASLDTTRMTLVFFAISGLDILNELPRLVDEETRKRIIEWIYSQQIIGKKDKPGALGFRGSPANGIGNEYDMGNVALTYAALATLIILGDDLQRVDRESLCNIKRDLQLENGCICGSLGSEADMRFVYCACVIAYLLNDWSIIDVDATVQFILASQTYEYAFGQKPGCEAHGGSTFCAVASLCLMGRLESALSKCDQERLKRWLVLKQSYGFQGRPNKDPDTCYSFWIGATLKLLGGEHLMNHEQNVDFIQLCTNLDTGGIAKYPGNSVDALHTYLALSALSLDIMDPKINITSLSLSTFEERRMQMPS